MFGEGTRPEMPLLKKLKAKSWGWIRWIYLHSFGNKLIKRKQFVKAKNHPAKSKF
ncbi:MAG: hypothetical protein CM15mP58_06090 [Burkholderiaceae bacterium]|nr:MAG: hypothetical protein CM15mP58_06090 [Burkholderiaceae bacterium]